MRQHFLPHARLRMLRTRLLLEIRWSRSALTRGTHAPPACPASCGAARAPHARPPAWRPAAQEPFAGEERRLALLAALLLQLRAAEAPAKKKGARAPAAAHIVREALKWRARDADAVAEAHAAAPELLRLHARLRARPPPRGRQRASAARCSEGSACSRHCGRGLDARRCCTCMRACSGAQKLPWAHLCLDRQRMHQRDK